MSNSTRLEDSSGRFSNNGVPVTWPPFDRAVSRGVTALELDEMVFPPVKWAISGVLPEGLAVLAGNRRSASRGGPCFKHWRSHSADRCFIWR